MLNICRGNSGIRLAPLHFLNIGSGTSQNPLYFEFNTMQIGSVRIVMSVSTWNYFELGHSITGDQSGHFKFQVSSTDNSK